MHAVGMISRVDHPGFDLLVQTFVGGGTVERSDAA